MMPGPANEVHLTPQPILPGIWLVVFSSEGCSAVRVWAKFYCSEILQKADVYANLSTRSPAIRGMSDDGFAVVEGGKTKRP